MRAAAFAATAAAVRAPAGTGGCEQRPALCLPNETCVSGGGGRCVVWRQPVNCFRFPGTCAAGEWCQLEDHKSFFEADNSTHGRCVPYARECQSCTRTYVEDNPPEIPGLGAFAFEDGAGARADAAVAGTRGFGHYLSRTTRCMPGLACTGAVIPSLPPTCVQERAPALGDRPTRGLLLYWAQRMLRMGARTYMTAQAGRGVGDQEPQGTSRADLRLGVNYILKALWPAAALGPYPGALEENRTGLLCCRDPAYVARLSEFQRARGGAEFRNPADPTHLTEGNPPGCAWCAFDGAYNDENPSVWSVVHALTFNLPEAITPYQRQILRSIPLWLRQHLSCPLCRSHIREHLVELGVPDSLAGVDWAKFFWRAHNYINEQSMVTRCGSQSCGWGTFTTPPPYKCAGVYRYPWFMSFASATKQWRVLPPADAERQRGATSVVA